jgi:hypothetical protein
MKTISIPVSTTNDPARPIEVTGSQRVVCQNTLRNHKSPMEIEQEISAVFRGICTSFNVTPLKGYEYYQETLWLEGTPLKQGVISPNQVAALERAKEIVFNLYSKPKG